MYQNRGRGYYQRGRGRFPPPQKKFYDRERMFAEIEESMPQNREERISKPKSQATRRRDEARQDQHRLKKGEKFDENLKKELDKTLFFGFTMEAKAVEAQRIVLSPQAKVLPVSTRAIGFVMQAIFVKLFQTMRNIPQCNVYEAYRVSLAQFEYKMIESINNCVLNMNQAADAFEHFIMNIDFRSALLGCQINFNVIASLINAVGSFEYNDKRYYCRLPRRDTPDPLTVTFSNLERVVLALSREATPREVRLHFYNNNPLPGARWRGIHPGRRGRHDMEFEPNPVLVNPRDFWPENFNIQTFLDDVQRYNGLLNWTSRKSLKYVNIESKIDYTGPGLPTCLISSKINDDLMNPMPRIVDGNIDWANSGLPIGTLDEFWTPEHLDDTTAFIGILQLLGETPPELDERYLNRHESVSARRVDHLWPALFVNMMG